MKKKILRMTGSLVLSVSILSGCLGTVTPSERKIVLNYEQKQQVAEVQTYIDKYADKEMNKGDLVDISKGLELYNALDDDCKASLKNGEVLQTKMDELNNAIITKVIDNIDAIYPIDDFAATRMETAWSSYNLLSDEQKEAITNYDILEGAQADYDQYKADFVNDLVAELPEEITYENRDEVFDVYSKYNNLTTDQKGYVTDTEKIENSFDTCVSSCKDRYNELLSTVNTVTLDSSETLEEMKSIYYAIPLDCRTDIDYDTLSDKLDTYNILFMQAEFNEKKLSKGDIISNDGGYSSEFKSCQITNRILPQDTSGYYWYYDAPDGFYYVDCVFYVTNLSTSTKSMDGFISSATLYIDGKEQSLKPLFYYSNSSMVETVSDFIGIGYNSGLTIHVAFRISEYQKKNCKSVAVELEAGGVTSYAVAK